MKFIKLIEKEGYSVSIYDPLVKHFEYPLSNLDDAVKDTDCIVIITDHNAFKNMDYCMLLNSARHRNILDTRNIVSQNDNFKLVTLGKTKSL